VAAIGYPLAADFFAQFLEIPKRSAQDRHTQFVPLRHPVAETTLYRIETLSGANRDSF